jgi:hypothetical protein
MISILLLVLLVLASSTTTSDVLLVVLAIISSCNSTGHDDGIFHLFLTKFDLRVTKGFTPAMFY